VTTAAVAVIPATTVAVTTVAAVAATTAAVTVTDKRGKSLPSHRGIHRFRSQYDFTRSSL
jgi:hypothetical protein